MQTRALHCSSENSRSPYRIAVIFDMEIIMGGRIVGRNMGLIIKIVFSKKYSVVLKHISNHICIVLVAESVFLLLTISGKDI